MRLFAYDSLGRLIAEKIPELQSTLYPASLTTSTCTGAPASNAWTMCAYTYDGNSNVKSTIDNAGNVLESTTTTDLESTHIALFLQRRLRLQLRIRRLGRIFAHKPPWQSYFLHKQTMPMRAQAFHTIRWRPAQERDRSACRGDCYYSPSETYDAGTLDGQHPVANPGACQGTAS